MSDDKDPAIEGAGVEGAPSHEAGAEAGANRLLDADAAPSDALADAGAIELTPADGAAGASSAAGPASVAVSSASASSPAAAAITVAAAAVDPAYTDASAAGAGGAAPPGGNNALSKLVALTMTAQGSFTFKIAVLVVVLSVLFSSCFLNYWEIHLYFTNYDDNKACERPLGMWLYVSGISGFLGLSLSTAGSVMVVIAKRTRDQLKIKSGVALHCLNQLNNLFTFIWMIYGSVLVYAIDSDTTLCPKSTYNFTWYFITSTWSVSGSVLFLALVATIATLLYRRYHTVHFEFDDRLSTGPV